MSLIFILISVWYFLYENNKQNKIEIYFSDYTNDYLLLVLVLTYTVLISSRN